LYTLQGFLAMMLLIDDIGDATNQREKAVDGTD
jgi:hypothetical protein